MVPLTEQRVVGAELVLTRFDFACHAVAEPEDAQLRSVERDEDFTLLNVVRRLSTNREAGRFRRGHQGRSCRRQASSFDRLAHDLFAICRRLAEEE